MSLTVDVISSSPLMSYILLLLVIVSGLLVLVFSNRKLTAPLPPGPWGLPVVGVLPLMGSRPYLTVQRWWDQYGDVVSVYMGSRLVLIVNGVETMKECFIRQADVFSGRPDNYFKRVTKGKGKCVIENCRNPSEKCFYVYDCAVNSELAIQQRVGLRAWYNVSSYGTCEIASICYMSE
jgi:hypothetical protein